jgi:hypothetical protein
MGSRIGKISVIPKDFSSAFPTMEKSLREKGMSRVPGTVKMIFPYRELSGKYRTGLDPNAKYLDKIADPKLREIERRRIIELKEKLESETGIDLSPNSPYYNYTSKGNHKKVEPVKLIDGDNIFNLDDPWQHVTYCWLKAHPTIASSLQAYERGEYPHDTQYFINDEDVENEILYKKKKSANDAIIKFDSWSLEKRRKVARLLGLPVTEDTREEVVYNMVDSFLKKQSVDSGSFKGQDPIKVFQVYANLKDDVLYVKDLVELAFSHHIYRLKGGGKVYEGELELFKDKEELIEHLLDDSNQEDLLELERKLKLKKIAEV